MDETTRQYLERLTGISKAMTVRGAAVIGTGPGVGKTGVAAAVAVLLRKMGRAVGVFKPISTNCPRRREGLVSRDAEILAHAADAPHALDIIGPVRFKGDLPIGTDDWKRRRLPLDRVVDSYGEIASDGRWMIVEMHGAVMSPLQPRFYTADLLEAFRLPVVLVAPTGTGTIDQVLLIADVLARRGLPLAGVAINRYSPESATLTDERAPDVLQLCLASVPIAQIPFDEDHRPAAGIIGPDVTLALENLAANLGAAQLAD